MSIYLSTLSLLFLTFYAGYLLKGRNAIRISSFVAHSFLYSMMLCWVLFLLSYVFDLSALVLLGLMILSGLLCLRFGGYNSLILQDKITLVDTGFIALVLLSTGLVLVGGFFYINQFYTVVFGYWDAVVSYNRWAIELSNGSYEVGGAAYPILYPGLWSLIYRIQGDVDFWILSKASLLIAPVVVWLYATAIAIERRSLFPVVFLLACFGLVIYRNNFFLQGMMDIPQVILAILVCLMLWAETTHKPENGPADDASFIAAAIGALIKQAGLAFLVLVILVKLIESRGIRQFWARHRKNFIISLLLPSCFAVFFLYYNDFQIIPKSFTGLRMVAENAAGTLGVVEHALSLVRQYLPLELLVPLLVFVILGISAAVPKLRLVAVLSLLIAGLGFLAWMRYSSYDIRNFYWILILVIFASSIGLTALLEKAYSFIIGKSTKKPGREWQVPRFLLLNKSLLLIVPLIIPVALGVIGQERLNAINDTARDQMIPGVLGRLFSEDLIAKQPDYSVITNIEPLRWVPRLKGHVYFDILRGNYKKLRNRVRERKDVFLLLKKLPDGGEFRNVTRLESEGLITFLSDRHPYALYRIKAR